MAADYWTSTQYRHWLFTRKTLSERRRALEEVDQNLIQHYPLPDRRHLSYFFQQQLMKLGKRMHIRQQAIATAQVYIRRLYLKVEIRRTNPYLIVATSLYLACKMEECPQHIRTIVGEARTLWPDFVVSDISKLGECEFFLISEMDCQLIVHHPYRTLTQLQGPLNIAPEELNLAWSIINDHYLTDLPLLYPLHIIAVTAIFLALIRKPSTTGGLQAAATSIAALAQGAQIQHNADASNTDEAASQQSKLQSLLNWVAEGEVDIKAMVECTQEIITLYEVLEQHNDKTCKEQISRVVKARNLDSEESIGHTAGRRHSSTVANTRTIVRELSAEPRGEPGRVKDCAPVDGVHTDQHSVPIQQARQFTLIELQNQDSNDQTPINWFRKTRKRPASHAPEEKQTAKRPTITQGNSGDSASPGTANGPTKALADRKELTKDDVLEISDNAKLAVSPLPELPKTDTAIADGQPANAVGKLRTCTPRVACTGTVSNRDPLTHLRFEVPEWLGQVDLRSEPEVRGGVRIERAENSLAQEAISLLYEERRYAWETLWCSVVTRTRSGQTGISEPSGQQQEHAAPEHLLPSYGREPVESSGILTRPPSLDPVLDDNRYAHEYPGAATEGNGAGCSGSLTEDHPATATSIST